MHLKTEELVDIAERTRPESAAPHLAACDACQAQLRDLRAMLSAAREVEVPEPSPLFWDHLSARVSEAVAAEKVGMLSWTERLMAVRAYAVAAVAAAVLVAALLSPRAPSPAVDSSPAAAVAAAAAELLADVAPDSDPSLTLVASLTDDVDLETAREAGLAPRGSAEHAVTHMSDGELRELGRLLKEELARPEA